MKFLISGLFALAAFVLPQTAIAKKGKVKADEFNQAIHESIHNLVQDNPEKYETRNPGRFPASVKPARPAHSADKEERNEKMNSLQKEGIGLPKW